MVKKFEAEVDCTAAIEAGCTHFGVCEDGEIVFFPGEPLHGDSNYKSNSGKSFRAYCVRNWKDLCFKIAENRPVWLTKEYEERLLAEGLNCVICDFGGRWYAFSKIPLLSDDTWEADNSCHANLCHDDFCENHDWQDSLIRLGEMNG